MKSRIQLGSARWTAALLLSAATLVAVAETRAAAGPETGTIQVQPDNAADSTGAAAPTRTRSTKSSDHATAPQATSDASAAPIATKAAIPAATTTRDTASRSQQPAAAPRDGERDAARPKAELPAFVPPIVTPIEGSNATSTLSAAATTSTTSATWPPVQTEVAGAAKAVPTSPAADMAAKARPAFDLDLAVGHAAGTAAAFLAVMCSAGWWITRQRAKAVSASPQRDRLVVVASRALAPRRSVHLIEVDGMRVLVGVDAERIQPLAFVPGSSPAPGVAQTLAPAAVEAQPPLESLPNRIDTIPSFADELPRDVLATLPAPDPSPVLALTASLKRHLRGGGNDVIA